MYSIESAGVKVTLRPLPLLSDARELQRTGGVMLDVRGQRPDIFVNVVISIASTGALDNSNHAFELDIMKAMQVKKVTISCQNC